MAATIFVVDDDPDYLSQMEMQLKEAGYSVITADSAAAAEPLLDRQFDLAVLDLMLEERDSGFTLTYKIKKSKPQTPVVIVTAVASETGISFKAATEEDRAWVKADALLDKPVRIEQLKREITRLLKK